MFKKVSTDVVSFQAYTSNDQENIKLKKTFKDASSQSEKEVKHKEFQVKTTSNLEVQTEEVVQNLSQDYNDEHLASFLDKVFPSLIEELDKVDKSKAFTFYQSINEENLANKVTVLHTILSENLPNIPGAQILCTAWSCTDNVVILGYGTTEHEDWCAHSSRVDFFNIKTSDFNGKTPTYSIPTSSCVTCIAPHPYEPAIVAVGTAGGEVHIWNLQNGQFDADIGNSVFHEDRVTKLSWENINSQLYLVSSSVDSFMFLFKITPKIGSVQLTERYLMTTGDSLLRAGIVHYSFSSQPGVFAVALENGDIIHCSTFGAPNIPSIPAKNPVLRVIHKASARTLHVQFSPYLEHVFAAIFTNNKLLGFSLKETAPLFEVFIEYDVLGLTWSKTQANIIYIWGKLPKLCVYKGDSGQLITELQPESTSLPMIKSISICSKSSRLVASGKEGKALIWDIPSYFKI